MKTQLTEQESLDIENRLLRDMAWRYARLITKEKAEMVTAKRTDKQENCRFQNKRAIFTKGGV